MKRLPFLVACAALFAAAVFVPAVAFAQEAAPAVAAAVDLKGQVLRLFVQIVVPILFTGLASALTWAFWKIGQKFGVDAGTAKKNQVVSHFLNLGKAVVADLEATLKPELLAATADGVLTPAEITSLRVAALDRLKFLAGEKKLEEAQFVLGMTSGALEVFLQGLLEHIVDGQPGKTVPLPAPASLNQALQVAAAGNPS